MAPKPRSLGHLFEMHATEHGDREAVVALTEARRSSLTWSSLYERSRALAGGLAANGLERGDRVAILLTNTHACEYFVTMGAAYIGDFVAVPINTRMAPPEIAQQLDRSGARILVTSAFFQEAIETDSGGSGQLSLIVDVGEAEGWGHDAIRFDEMLESAPLDPRANLDSTTDIMYTSGTTGRPKGATFDHRACLEHGRLWCDEVGFSYGESIMLASPVYTSTGTHSFPLPVIWSGMTLIFEEKFDTGLWFERIEQERPTYYLGVPSMYALILNAIGERDMTDFPAPRSLIYGGSPMPMPLAERLIETFPEADIWNIYGLTESGPTGTVLRPEDAIRKLGSVGRPYRGVSVRIQDPDGRELPSGEEGEIAILTPARMTGYRDDPENTARAIDEQGWLRSGDIGRFDEDGFLWVLDRKNDVINRGGFNVYPAEVESALLRHPDVTEAAVFGIPHPVLGEDVAACLVLRKGGRPLEEGLKEHCGKLVADYKRPRKYFYRDELPRNAMGKVLRRKLREQLG